MNPYFRQTINAVAGLLCLATLQTFGADATSASANRPPRISPDYTDLVLPPNIAPLNFKIEETGSRFKVRVNGSRGESIELGGRKPIIEIPIKAWHRLLQANTGTNIFVEISVRDDKSQWTQYLAITNSVSSDTIDPYLVYRLIKPLYNVYSNVGLYQRDLSNFNEIPYLRNSAFNHGCVNCHTFLDHSPRTMLVHIRGENTGNPMLLVQSNQVTKVENTAGYICWHPSGKLVTYSVNKLSLVYHTINETRDVYDAKSDLGIYRVDQNRVVVPPAIAKPDRQEVWPAWSPDGKYLYFCSAPVLPLERAREIRYDLMRVSYDIDKDVWGTPEVVVSAAETGLSASQPKVSPDGRYVLFCMAKWGHFPIYQASSDLYLLDIQTRQFRRLEINSPLADTWHCWSKNGHWIVFSSKRRDGLFARPHFSWFDGKGNFSKPFILPQENPEFYDSFIKTFNVPELIDEPIQISESEFGRAILAPTRVLKPTHDTNGPVLGPSVSEAERTQNDK